MKRSTMFRAVPLVFIAMCSAATAGAQQKKSVLGVDTSSFDRSIRPQDDFYGFVNGTWLKTYQLPADRTRYGTFIELADKSDEALKSIMTQLTSAQDVQPQGTNRAKVRDLYLAYMDTTQLNRLGSAPIASEQDRIRAIHDRAELPAAFAHLVSIGVQIPFSAFVTQDPRESDRYIVSIGQGGLGMPNRDFYVKTDARSVAVKQAYGRYIERVLGLAGRSDAADAAQKIADIEQKLAAAAWDPVKNRDRNATYNKMSMQDLQKLAPGFDWSAYLAAARIPASELIVRQPDAVQATAQLINTVPLDDMKAYLEYKLVNAFAPVLSSSFQAANFDFFSRTLAGQEVPRPRWKQGLDLTAGVLGEALGEMYVKDYFDAKSKTRMLQLVDNMRAAYASAIDELEWMSPATKIQAKDKLAKFTVKIAYPDKWRDYSALDIRPGDLAGNMMRAAEWSYNRTASRLGKPVDRTDWSMTPQTVNAYYNPANNEIVFPAAILQPPFFNADADDAVNYGAIGAVIGHEMSHGFDDQGRKSDGVGNLRDWWTAADATAFEERANRLAAEYSAFEPVPGGKVNGKLTLGENIGDLSGLAVAYRAYRNSLGGKPAPVIGGFTGDQRFFLGWAQIWRGTAREEAARQLLLTDPHSPGRYRTNGVLVNFDPFYKAWNVKPGDGMYVAPKDRIRIW